MRQPNWSPQLAQAVQELREQCPRWGKDKLAPVLRQPGWSVSTSMVGRIITRLRKPGLFLLPPRSPKLNGHVERAQRTHADELYQVWNLPLTITALNRKLRAWERISNTVRPHQTLG